MNDEAAELLKERPQLRRRIVALTVLLTVLAVFGIAFSIYRAWVRAFSAAMFGGMTSSMAGSRATSSAMWDSSAKAAPEIETTARRVAGETQITIEVTNPDSMTVKSFRIIEATIEGTKVKPLPPELKDIRLHGRRTLTFDLTGTFPGKTELASSIRAKFKHADGSGEEDEESPIPLK